jgi:hypothetical protein
MQRGEDRVHGIEPGQDIGDRYTDLLRLPIRRAGDGHDPAHPLDDVVIARPVRIGPVCPNPVIEQ